MKHLKNYILKSFAFVVSLLAVSTVNSACVIVFGQEKEPESLARFKKY